MRGKARELLHRLIDNRYRQKNARGAWTHENRGAKPPPQMATWSLNRIDTMSGNPPTRDAAIIAVDNVADCSNVPPHLTAAISCRGLLPE